MLEELKKSPITLEEFKNKYENSTGIIYRNGKIEWAFLKKRGARFMPLDIKGIKKFVRENMYGDFFNYLSGPIYELFDEENKIYFEEYLKLFADMVLEEYQEKSDGDYDYTQHKEDLANILIKYSKYFILFDENNAADSIRKYKIREFFKIMANVINADYKNIVQHMEYDKEYLLLAIVDRESRFESRMAKNNITPESVKELNIPLVRYFQIYAILPKVKNKTQISKILKYVEHIYPSDLGCDVIEYTDIGIHTHLTFNDLDDIYFVDMLNIPIELINKDTKPLVEFDSNLLYNIKFNTSYTGISELLEKTVKLKCTDWIYSEQYLELKLVLSYDKNKVKFNLKIQGSPYPCIVTTNSKILAAGKPVPIILLGKFLDNAIFEKWNIDNPLHKIIIPEVEYYKDWVKFTDNRFLLLRDLHKYPKISIVINYFNFNRAYNLDLLDNGASINLDGNNIIEIMNCSNLALKTFKNFGNDIYLHLNHIKAYDKLIAEGIPKETLEIAVKLHRYPMDEIYANYSDLRNLGVDFAVKWTKKLIQGINSNIIELEDYRIGTFVKRLFEIYVDYLLMCSRLKFKLNYISPYAKPTEPVNFQKNYFKINELHDDLIHVMNELQINLMDVSIGKVFENNKRLHEATSGDYVLLLAKTGTEIAKEGHDLNHCVKSYIELVAEERCLIAFLRNKKEIEKSLYTIELVKGFDGRYLLRQARGIKNTDLPENVMKDLCAIILGVNENIETWI